ncbi:hypothetical protein CBS9595_001958 [Malassezia furfur]|nr:hypothetical protein CBS9595_001958 [Malassezia furfur]
MATHREANNPSFAYVEPAAWPKDVPKVEEVGTTSAPLKSIAFFLGQFCKDYNDDFMLCKSEDRNPEHCLKEGRRVTRCAQDLIKRMNENCQKEWDAHWQCLEMNNQELFACRKQERPLNKCVLDQLIPGAPAGKPQIFEQEKQVYGRLQK